MLMPLFLGTLMATNVVNLFSPLLNSLLNIGCNDWFIAPGCFCFLLSFFFFFPVLGCLFVCKLNKSQPGMFVHWAVFLHFLMLFGRMILFTTQPKVDNRRADSMRCTKTNKHCWKGLFALVNMQCISPMAICYLIVAVSKCMWLKQ